MFVPLDQRALKLPHVHDGVSTTAKNRLPVPFNPYQSRHYLLNRNAKGPIAVILARGVVVAGILAALYACTDKATSFDDPRADPRDTGPMAFGA